MPDVQVLRGMGSSSLHAFVRSHLRLAKRYTLFLIDIMMDISNPI
jgi:hypothetical protein